jgi:hypothetical protein
MRTVRFHRTALVVAALFAALVSGCASGETRQISRGDSTQPTDSATHDSDSDVVETFTSLDTLRDASQLIVVGRAGSSVVTSIGGIRFTITDVQVQRLLSSDGPKVGSTVRVRQTGDATFAPSEGSEILSSGGTYLLYLSSFHFTDSDKTGQFVITGDQGLWQETPPGLFSRRSVVGRLPQQVSISSSGRGTVSAR